MRTATLILCVLLMGCESPTAAEEEVVTLDTAATELRPVTPPERLVFDVSRKDAGDSEEGAIERLEQGSRTGAYTENLPFAPLIAMDPVNGEKISIVFETPTAEYDDRIYYFGSEANKRTFLADPEEYTKGSFSRY